MRSWVDGNLAVAWQRVLQDVFEDDSEYQATIDMWEEMHPSRHDLRGFYNDYVWTVYGSGFKVEILDGLAPRIETALRDLDVSAISQDKQVVKADLLAVISHQKKAEAVIRTAAKLSSRPQIWDRLQRMGTAAALDELREFDGIGPDNRYHLARNLGWDVVAHGGFTLALSGALKTDCDTLIDYLSRVSKLRRSTTDIMLWHWSRLFETDDECIERFRFLIGL